MAKQIRANELFEKEDIFEGIRRSAEKTMVTLEKVDKEFKDLGETLKKSLGKASFGGSKELKEFLAMVEKANNLQTQAVKIEKEKAIAEQQAERLKREKLKTQTAENREQERQNKQKQRALKLAKDEQNAYKKLVKSTRDLKNESKKLGAELLLLEQSGKKNTAEYRKLESQYKRVTKSAQQGDVALKKLDKTVGDNFRNVGNYRGAISKLQGGLAQLGLAFGLSQVVRSSMDTIIDYGTANSKLASILGTTTEKTELLQKVQRELGASTSFTAGEVADLQTELAKIGFSQQDIADSTEGILLLAKASGTDLANASTIAGATLRGFGLDVKDTSHLADVMAKSFSSSALDIGLFGESMKYVAPVSKSANISLEETTALLSILADNGIKGSQAGTSLKRIMSEMAKTGKPLKEALQDVADAGVDLVSAQDEVGRSAQTSLLILSDNINKIDEFSEKYEKADGSALAMANTMDDNLAGALARLNSKWQDFLLGLNDGSGASEKMKNALDFLTKNLSTILSVVGKVIRAFLLYKTTMIGLRLIQRLYNTDFRNLGTMFMKQIPLTKAYRQEQQRLATATKESQLASKGLGSAIAGIGLGILIGVVTELALKFYDLASGMSDARRQAQLIAIDEEKGKKTRDDLIKQEKELFEEAKRKLDLEMDTRRAQTNIAKEKKKIDEEQVKREKELLKTSIDSIESKSKSAVISRNEFERDQEALNSYYKDFDKNFNKITALVDKYGARTQGATDNWKVLLSSKLQGGIKEQEIIIEGLATQTKDWTNQLDRVKVLETEIATNNKKNKTDEQPKKQKEFNTQLKQTNEYLSRQKELLQQLTEIEQDRALAIKTKGIDSEFERQMKSLQETGSFDASQLNQLIQERADMESEFIDQRTIYELDALEEKYRLIKEKELQQLDDDRAKKLAQTDITQEAIAKIEADYTIKKKELESNEEARQKDRATEEVIIVEGAENEKLEVYKSTNEQILDLETQLSEKLKELGNQRQQETREFVKATADYFIKKSNEKIAQIDKEIQASQKQYETLKKLAEEGNIDAKESLAEQQRIIAEANRKKEQEQKRQQRIKLAESVYSTYSQKIESNSKNPLAETIRDTTLLNQFIQSLPTFEDGTDDTGKNGRGIDGKGGFLSVLHPNERVVPKSLNAQIGGLTNEELSRIANEYNNGKIVRSDSQLGSALELSLLVGKLDNLTKVIQDKPETNIELGEITQGAMEIVKSTKEGNTYTYNRYKVK